MGAFGIFILVLSAIYAVYYIAMISMDLRTAKANGNKGEVEVIAVAEPVTEVEEPIEVNEEDYMKKPSSKAGEEEEEVLTAEEIERMQTEELYQEALKARNQMQSIRTTAQCELSLTKDSKELASIFEANFAGLSDSDNKEEE